MALPKAINPKTLEHVAAAELQWTRIVLTPPRTDFAGRTTRWSDLDGRCFDRRRPSTMFHGAGASSTYRVSHTHGAAEAGIWIESQKDLSLTIQT